MITTGYMVTCALGTQCTVLLCYLNGPIALFGPVGQQSVTKHVYQKAKVAIEHYGNNQYGILFSH